MAFKTEFPSFPADAFPTAIPAGFEDASWNNDACPCLRDFRRGLVIWINWPDRDGEKRYSFSVAADAHDPHELFAGNDWALMLAYLARISLD
jgi:hypothetical protein